MTRYLATFAQYEFSYRCKTITADSVKQAMEKVRNMCFTGTLKSLQTIHVSDDVKASRPEEILKMLNKLKKEYNKTYGTIQAEKIDSIIRFYMHLIALDEITEEFIRGLVE